MTLGYQSHLVSVVYAIQPPRISIHCNKQTSLHINTIKPKRYHLCHSNKLSISPLFYQSQHKKVRCSLPLSVVDPPSSYFVISTPFMRSSPRRYACWLYYRILIHRESTDHWQLHTRGWILAGWLLEKASPLPLFIAFAQRLPNPIIQQPVDTIYATSRIP